MNPTPYILNPEPYTLNPAPCTLNPEPYTLNPAPCTLTGRDGPGGQGGGGGGASRGYRLVVDAASPQRNDLEVYLTKLGLKSFCRSQLPHKSLN